MTHILIVEDDRDLALVYKEAFETEGFKVGLAADTKEVLSVFNTKEPEVILLDLMLPGGENGFDLLEQWSRNGMLARIPVIVFTNLDSEKNTALSLGARDYVIKADITPQKIVDTVKKYVTHPAGV